MEVKVWMDGYQRVVCGVTEQTTCQDLIVALAQASGVTGRYAMYEKWRTTENCLSPAEYPLLVLRKWGDYSHDVQFILRHSAGPATDGRKICGVEDGGPGPPGRSVDLKKSLTISGAHGRARGAEACPRNNVGHSVDSSEQSSVASHSSASLSPCASLERRSNVNGHEANATSNGLRKDKDRPVGSVQTPLLPAERRLGVLAAGNVSRQNGRPSKPQVPQPTGGLKTQVPRPGNQGPAGKEPLFNGTKRIFVSDNSGSEGTSSSSSPVVSQSQNVSNSGAAAAAAAVISSVPSKNVLHHRQRHDANDRDLLVTQSSSSSSSSKAPILGSSILKLVATSKSQPNRGKDSIRDFDIKDTEHQSATLRMATAEEKEEEEERQHQHPPPAAKKFQVPRGAWAYPLPHFPPPPAEAAPPSTVSSGAIRRPNSASAESRSSSESGADPVAAPSERPESTSGAEERETEERVKRRELVELIRAQEQELQKYESRLKELDCEISLMEGDAEVEERQLEEQLRKIEEMEALEKAVDSELEELELISWEEKLEMERQKEVRMQREILLLRSGIEKSESEIKEITSKTEDVAKEFNQRLLEKQQEKEKQEIEDLEENLLQEKMLLQVSSKSLKSLEKEIVSVDNCLLRKREDLSELEDQLKQLNLELFIKQATQDTSTSGRSPLLDQLGLLRPKRVHRSHVIEGPPPPSLPRRLDCTLVEARSHAPEFV